MRHSVSSSQSPIIETERLILRVEEEADAPAIRELLLDPEGRKFTGGAIERSLDEIRGDIRNNASRFSLQVENVLTGDGHCCFGVLKKPDLTYIGYCGIRFCSVMKEVELLYGYWKAFWGRGYATEAANAALDFGLSKIRLPAVFAAVHPLNPASEQVIVKCGMRYLREIEWPRNGNVRMFGITAEEHERLCGTGKSVKYNPSKYLRDSEIVDYKHPLVFDKAKELANGCHSDDEITKRCFEFVRDSIQHSWDYRRGPVTCKASDVLNHGTGLCYAKSHLLAALLRANEIPAGLCYQRLAVGEEGPPFCLHGLNAVHLKTHGWYRIDARGNKPGVSAAFTPPMEQLAFSARGKGEKNFPAILVEPLPEVVQALTGDKTIQQVMKNLPDLEETHSPKFGYRLQGPGPDD